MIRVLLALLVILVPRLASAHAIGVSRGAYSTDGNTVTATIAFARGELLGSVPALDPEHKGELTAARLVSERAAIETRVQAGLRIGGDDAPCAIALADARLTEEDGVVIVARATCPAAVAKVSVELRWLDDLSSGHRHFVALRTLEAETHTVLMRGQASFTFAAAGAEMPEVRSAGSTWTLLRMGIEHILTGYDHLVFLLGLVLVGGRIRALVGVITAFTVAHSITLAIAALGVWTPSARVIEPAIAVSIAYVGLENFFVKDANRRWRITFPFGLIHGFGFASALREISLPRGEIPRALVLFNLGVEAGQLAVLALVLPLILYLRRSAWVRDRGVRYVSAAIVASGVIWAVLRIARPNG